MRGAAGGGQETPSLLLPTMLWRYTDETLYMAPSDRIRLQRGSASPRGSTSCFPEGRLRIQAS